MFDILAMGVMVNVTIGASYTKTIPHPQPVREGAAQFPIKRPAKSAE